MTRKSNAKSHKIPEISSFLAGKSILVTGASGFLGKVLIEKLLYDNHDINTIYILLRTKGTAQAQSRLAQLFESRAFDRIKRDYPELLKKVKVIRGDITFNNLAISAKDLAIIKDEVSIIIHSAATIRFDEPLSRAVRINVTATKMLLELATQLNDLKSFIHISTAYCNQNKVDIEESVYDEILSPEKLIELTNDLTDEMLESMAPHLYGTRPSSYHYTKAMAEQLVKSYSDRIPVGIVRPSIIAASLREPMPGWVDNYNGISGYMAAAGPGVLRAMKADSSKICDVIPVDIVANTIIASAWHVAKARQNQGTSSAGIEGDNQPLVINCTSGQINPLTWGVLRDLCQLSLVKYPPNQVFRYPGPTLITNKTMYEIFKSVDQDLPRFVIDFVFKLLGVKPILGPIYEKLNRTTKALEFFTTNEWIYQNKNFLALNEDLSPQDGNRFLIDVRQIDWPSYIENHVLGVRHYLMEEDPNTIRAAKFKLDLIYYGTQAAKASIAGLSAFGLYKLIKIRRLRN